MTLDPRIEQALDRFDDEEISQSPPEDLPLLDRFRDHQNDREAFANVDVLFIQHT